MENGRERRKENLLSFPLVEIKMLNSVIVKIYLRFGSRRRETMEYCSGC